MYLYDEELAKGIQGADSVSVYRSVFVRHGCSEEEYKKTIACYAKQPKVMKEIYEAVKVRLEGYKAEFEQALQLENYLRDTAVSSYDTLFYMAFEDDSAAQRRVYLPKFRLQPKPVDSLFILRPEQPELPEQPEQPDELKQHHKLEIEPERHNKPEKLDKSLRSVPPDRVRPARLNRSKPLEQLQRLP
jgi:hypothetical protein